jgi:hypothetical protein
VHTHNTRQLSQLHIENKRTVLFSNSFINRGPDYWNGLPEKNINSATTKIFNKQHKLFLTNSYTLET